MQSVQWCPNSNVYKQTTSKNTCKTSLTFLIRRFFKCLKHNAIFILLRIVQQNAQQLNSSKIPKTIHSKMHISHAFVH